ncbi:MAG: aldo/keto reductase, partial [Thermosphaera sp.]|nr:aldo/keto reductase [Thermosphaera sp.]
TGKYSLGALPEFKDVRGGEAVFHPENFAKLEKLLNTLRDVAAKYGKTPTQVVLNWMLKYSPVMLPIPGAKTPEQVEELAGAIGWELSYEDWRRIDEESRSIKISYATW